MKQIKLTQGKVVLVDDEDFDWLNQWKWFAQKSRNTYYTIRNVLNKNTKKRFKVSMHKLILNPLDGLICDHIDGNGLNNQRSNLRICTNQQNSCNRGVGKNASSGVKGVYKHYKNWQVRIKANYKLITIGTYKTKQLAVIAYNNAALKYYGEFAYLNKISKIKDGK